MSEWVLFEDLALLEAKALRKAGWKAVSAGKERKRDVGRVAEGRGSYSKIVLPRAANWAIVYP